MNVDFLNKSFWQNKSRESKLIHLAGAVAQQARFQQEDGNYRVPEAIVDELREFLRQYAKEEGTFYGTRLKTQA